jgi:hypothetical protein
MLSLLTICAAIFLFIPWQVAYLGCWVLHLYTCATARQHQQEVAHGSRTDAVPMTNTRRDSAEDHGAMSPTLPPRKPPSEFIIRQSNLNHSLHMLLLMTWLLPFTSTSTGSVGANTANGWFCDTIRQRPQFHLGATFPYSCRLRIMDAWTII